MDARHRPARRIRHRPVLRRQHDHPRRFGSRRRSRVCTVYAGLEPAVVPLVGRHPGRPLHDPDPRHREGRHFFGPIMLIYFVDPFGARHAAHRQMPTRVRDAEPAQRRRFFLADPFRGFLAMGSVVLAVTGAEALYADMGHFGRKPIASRWLVSSCPRWC